MSKSKPKTAKAEKKLEKPDNVLFPSTAKDVKKGLLALPEDHEELFAKAVKAGGNENAQVVSWKWYEDKATWSFVLHAEDRGYFKVEDVEG